nr:MAG TPA: hypothetical protein [Bacteriophage sp.]
MVSWQSWSIAGASKASRRDERLLGSNPRLTAISSSGVMVSQGIANPSSMLIRAVPVRIWATRPVKNTPGTRRRVQASLSKKYLEVNPLCLMLLFQARFKARDRRSGKIPEGCLRPNAYSVLYIRG